MRPPSSETTYRIGSNNSLEGVDVNPARCPLWVKSRRSRRKKPCPLYPRKRTIPKRGPILPQLPTHKTTRAPFEWVSERIRKQQLWQFRQASVALRRIADAAVVRTFQWDTRGKKPNDPMEEFR